MKDTNRLGSWLPLKKILVFSTGSTIISMYKILCHPFFIMFTNVTIWNNFIYICIAKSIIKTIILLYFNYIDLWNGNKLAFPCILSFLHSFILFIPPPNHPSIHFFFQQCLDFILGFYCSLFRPFHYI